MRAPRHSGAGGRGLLAALATLVSAVAYGAAFPPLAWRPLAWVALAPFLVALRGGSLGRALGLAWLWAVVAAWAVGDWFPRAVADYWAQPAWVGLGLFFGVSTLMAALQYMGFAAVYRALGADPGDVPGRRARRGTSRALRPLLAAAAWVVAEAARAKLLSGNPWALAGYSQMGLAPLVQVAELTGVYGISFALVAVNAALAELWLARDEGARFAALRGLGLATAVVAGASCWGVARLVVLGPAIDRDEDRGMPLVVVQGDVDVGSTWRPDFYGRNLEVYLRLTRSAIAQHAPALVVWPENAMTFFLENEPLYRRAIARLLEPSGIPLLAGGPLASEPQAERYLNAAFVLDPDGTITAVYEKEHLLPFAEYFPFAWAGGLQRRFGRVREFVPGRHTAALPTPIGRAGILICNEALFPEVAARRVRDGAEVLVNLANDGWLGDAKFSAIAFDMVSLRAVETRRWLVRASTSGPSGIVDPLGRVHEASPTASRAVLAGTVRREPGLTPYVRFGDVLVWVCAVAVGGMLAWVVYARWTSGRPE